MTIALTHVDSVGIHFPRLEYHLLSIKDFFKLQSTSIIQTAIDIWLSTMYINHTQFKLELNSWDKYYKLLICNVIHLAWEGPIYNCKVNKHNWLYPADDNNFLNICQFCARFRSAYANSK